MSTTMWIHSEVFLNVGQNRLKKDVDASTKVSASMSLNSTTSQTLHIFKVGAKIKLYPIASRFLHIFKVGASIRL